MTYLHKIITLLAILLFNSSLGWALTDIATLRISYRAGVKSTLERPQRFDDMTLLIGERSSCCFSATHVAQQQLLDSVVRVSGGNLSQVLGASAQMRASSKLGQPWVVLKNYPSPHRLTYTTELLGKETFRYEEELPQWDWELLEGDSLIAEYACHKARATHRGRTWTVWYTPDITVSEGPWKLCGLPGLILYAVSDNADFTFECTGIQQAGGEPIALPQKAYTHTNARDLQKLEVLTITHPEEVMTRLYGLRGSGTAKRKQLTPLLIEDYNKE